ncbi:recombinase family protein [uncultured Gimesia sp.]|uniref:recombinase family protein n=1 Tax=uncultured Gimesia sp. TaxID=1678688 RepID=UPI0030D7B4C3|tara:strand:+ start:59626 stop:60330 length:705 start_codon:yes stop_codon:yes gene_type:complete
MKRKVSAWVMLNRKYPPSEPGKASDYFAHFETLNAKDVVLYCRVSSSRQHQNTNLADQERSLKRLLERLGVTVHATYGCIESGWDNDHWMDRATLAYAAAEAEKLGAVLVFESTSRAIRSIWYHPSRNNHAQPTKAEYEKFLQITKGAKLATIAHPDITPEAERGLQSRRGMTEKNRKGGRPRKRTVTKWPQETISRAIDLRQAGNSLGEIAKTLNVPRPTVQSWAKRYMTRGV